MNEFLACALSMASKLNHTKEGGKYGGGVGRITVI